MILYQGTIHPNLNSVPKSRIVSIVPSISWYLYDLLDSNSIIGISKFCEIPESVKSKPIRVGGTKTPHIDKIRKLKPDLIVANKEENTKESVEELAEDFDVYLSDVSDLDSMYQMMLELGLICGHQHIAENWVNKISLAYTNYKLTNQIKTPHRVAYLIWKDPYMVACKNTFIHSFLDCTGFINCFENRERYPIVSLNQILEEKPDVILLSSEPYPFNQSHFEAFGDNPCALVDGKIFSWYGSYIFKSFTYLNALKGQLNSIK